MAETGKGGADQGASMRIDTALVRELAELLSDNDLNELEVEDGDRKIKVRRDATTAFVSAPSVAMPAAAAAPPDREGKKVCGWTLMNESERGGYKNIMHQTKELADRDGIRTDHCARMQARAKERGVPAEE